MMLGRKYLDRINSCLDNEIWEMSVLQIENGKKVNHQTGNYHLQFSPDYFSKMQPLNCLKILTSKLSAKIGFFCSEYYLIVSTLKLMLQIGFKYSIFIVDFLHFKNSLASLNYNMNLIQSLNNLHGRKLVKASFYCEQ